jgi:hypothetical protein
MIERLTPLLGAWDVQVALPQAEGVRGRTVFEEILDGRFVLTRTEVDHAQAPDSVSLIVADASGDAYTQHYFDSRGVVRLYAMTFRDRTWTLARERPDFSPLDFAQRFAGTLADDGRTIRAAWETAHDDGPWELDFELVYTRAE